MSDELVWAAIQAAADGLADHPGVGNEKVASALLAVSWTFMRNRMKMSPEEILARVGVFVDLAERDEAKNEKERPS